MIIANNNKIGELNFGSPINKVYGGGGKLVFSNGDNNYFEGFICESWNYYINSIEEFYQNDFIETTIIIDSKSNYDIPIFANYYDSNSFMILTDFITFPNDNIKNSLENSKIGELIYLGHSMVIGDRVNYYFVPKRISKVNINDFEF